MSRSYKKQPFMAICGGGSARWDKIFAHRGERRKNLALIQRAMRNDDWEEFLPAKKHECAHNEVYSWGRDGNQYYQTLGGYSRDRYYRSIFDPDYLCFGDEDYMVWHPMWYQKMMRK